MPSRPNIVLITTDQQRFDTLGENGNKLIKTPHIDDLSRGAINFTNAFIQNTICGPSRASMQTGRYPHQHGFTYMEDIIHMTEGLPEWERTFMEILQDDGYQTAARGKIDMYPDKGFHNMVLTSGKGARWYVTSGSPLGPSRLGADYAAWLERKRPGAYEQLYAERRRQASGYEEMRASGIYDELWVMDLPLSEEEYVDAWVADESVRYIERAKASADPFFLWIGFCGPHTPFDPPEPYRSLYTHEDVPVAADSPGWPSWRETFDEAFMRKAVAYYWGMVSCIDHQVGRIRKALVDADIFDNTAILYTSDHGELLGERGRFGKALFFDSVLRVPLWIKPPSTATSAPRHVSDLVETFDIAPTILDLAGIAPPITMAARSLMPHVTGAGVGKQNIFSEYVSHDKMSVGKCIRTASHKYVRWLPGPIEELYDLNHDANEQKNLVEAPEYKHILAELKGNLLDWLTKSESRYMYC